MQLSKNFFLSEMLKSNTALQLGIDNTPSADVVANLQRLCEHVLQAVRDNFQQAVVVNSGYRCQKLNSAVGSSSGSQHTKGQAADIEIPGISTYDLANWIAHNLDYDQLILEMYNPNDPDPNSGWVHVSYVAPGVNRHQNLTYLQSKKYVPGLVASNRVASSPASIPVQHAAAPQSNDQHTVFNLPKD